MEMVRAGPISLSGRNFDSKIIIACHLCVARGALKFVLLARVGPLLDQDHAITSRGSDAAENYFMCVWCLSMVH
jgi:hypothetical protein